MNRKTFVMVTLLAAVTLALTSYGANHTRPATASALSADGPSHTQSYTQAESPLAKPTGEAPHSPLVTPDMVAPESPLTTRGAVSPQSPLRTPAFSAALSPDSLKNQTYLSSYGKDGTVTLEDGEYSKPVSPGAASRDVVTLLPEHTAYGVLHGLPAAAVVLRSGGGGSGTFYDLAIVVELDGEPINIASTNLGDRIHIYSTALRDNRIIVDMVTHGRRDAACCPTQRVINTYELRGDDIVEFSTDVIGTVEPDAITAESAPLEGTPWLLTRVRDVDEEITAAIPGSDAAITLEVGVVSGSTGCNTFSGSYTATPDAKSDGRNGDISFGELATTAMACPDALMRQEKDVSNALGETTSYMISDGTLRLYDNVGSLWAEYVAAPQTTIVGSTWSATRYNNGKGGSTSLINGTEIAAVFGEDGMLTGNAGCNNYSASYAVEGDSIKISPAAVTRMLCNKPDGIMEQENAYLAALPAAAVYRLDVDTLELRTDDGASVAAYRIETGQDDSICNADVVGNIEYAIDEVDEPFLMQDGAYADEANRTTAGIMPDIITCGDVTGDGEDDALVPVWANTGGTGVFVYLTVVSEEDGEPTNIASAFLGDRIKITSVTIDEADAGASTGDGPPVVVEMITQGPNDGMCCPSQQARNTYQWQDGKFIEVASEVVEGLTPVKLANMPYQVEETETGTAWLMRGIHEESSAPESSLLRTVMLAPESVAFGDIDGVPSAAVVLVAQLDGESTQYHLALVQEADGRPEHMASALLGDRVILNSDVFEGDEIVVDMVTQGPDDPECCPSTRLINTYALMSDELIEVASEIPSRREAATQDLIDHVWQWQGSAYGNDTEAIPDDPSKYTLEFKNDGTVAADVDCNRAKGQYDVDGASLSINLTASTRAACAEGSLEAEYVRDLSGVAIHFFQDGDLYLDIQMDSGTMHFAK